MLYFQPMIRPSLRPSASGGPRFGAGRWTIASLAFFASAATAHEFWMLPSSFNAAVGGSISLSLNVGEYFAGERVAISQALLAEFRHHGSGSNSDLRPRVPANPVGELVVGNLKAGTHLLAMDTQPSHIVLPADKFHSYLHEEGLDFIIKAREAAGTAASPGRERYRRNVKTLLQAGSPSDATYSLRTGQKIEILPMADPLRHSAGRNIAFQVLFEGRPLAGALVKFWHRRNGQTLMIRTVTNAEGTVTATPPWPGVWMVSVVHMIPASDSREHDWDSFWGNLTFALPRNGKTALGDASPLRTRHHVMPRPIPATSWPKPASAAGLHPAGNQATG